MLLLLLPHSKYQVRDVFDVWQGITLLQPHEKTVDANPRQHLYKVINLSGINACSKVIDESNLIDYPSERDKSHDKLLAEHDYLISCKGEVRGYSLLNSKEVLDNIKKQGSCDGLVASNHFLILRPRMCSTLSSEEIRFLHNILDIILLKFKLIATGKPGIAKYLTINDVANYSIHYPYTGSFEIEKFDDIFKRYLEKLHELKEVKKELDSYNRYLASTIIMDQNNSFSGGNYNLEKQHVS
jgi:hypothetical protein